MIIKFKYVSLRQFDMDYELDAFKCSNGYKFFFAKYVESHKDSEKQDKLNVFKIISI